MSAKKRRRKNAGTVSITIIVLAFLAVMAVQICKLKQKDSDYQAKEAELQKNADRVFERKNDRIGTDGDCFYQSDAKMPGECSNFVSG